MQATLGMRPSHTRVAGGSVADEGQKPVPQKANPPTREYQSHEK
jgi:hypothetical protein